VELLILVKEDIFRRRPILGNRILTPVRDDDKKEEPKFRPRPILGDRILAPASQRARGDNNTQISAGGNVRTNLPQEPSPMELAMEEIRAAQKQREAHAKQLEEQAKQYAQFEQMMGGAFRDATGRMITGLSEEARDYIGILMAQGMDANEAEDAARQQFGE